MRGVVALVRPRGVGPQREGRRGVRGVDGCAQAGRMGFRDQALDRNTDLIGIAEKLRAIRIGPLHRLDHQVQCRGRSGAETLQRIALQDIEHLDQVHAARGGRRNADDLVAAIAAAQRHALQRPIILQVLAAEDSAGIAHAVGDFLRDLALIERARPVPRDGFERAGEVGLHQPVAGREQSAVRFQEDLRRGGKAGEPRRGARQRIRELVLDQNALAGERDCRRDQVGKLEFARAVLFERQRQSGDRPRHARGQPGIAGFLRVILAVPVEEHVARCRPRRGLAIIDRSCGAVGEPDQHESAAAEIAGLRVRHRQRKGDRHRRIHGVAAAMQHLEPDVRRALLLAHDHRMLGDDCLRRRKRRLGTRGREQRKEGEDQSGAVCAGRASFRARPKAETRNP